MNKSNILFIVAGGSGGHILPAIQLGKVWSKNYPEYKTMFFCGNKKIDLKIVKNNNYLDKVFIFNLDKFPGKMIWKYPKFLLQLILVYIRSLHYLFKFKPKKIISTGGYISIPICTLARFFGIDVELHELNVIPGRAVKVLLPFAKKVYVTFESTMFFLRNRMKNFSKRCFLQDYPMRFSSKDRVFNKNDLINCINKDFCCNFYMNYKTIFILGGSQGSLFLNKIFKNWLFMNKEKYKNIQIIHQTGSNDKTDWISFYKKNNISAIVFSYMENIKNFYLISDLVISRAGAGILFELEFFKKKSLIIPLKSTYTDHQINNAFEMIQRNPELFFSRNSDDIVKDFSIFEGDMERLIS
ncbi:glycosyltransferase [Candidatus Dependentiae bacterium]